MKLLCNNFLGWPAVGCLGFCMEGPSVYCNCPSVKVFVRLVVGTKLCSARKAVKLLNISRTGRCSETMITTTSHTFAWTKKKAETIANLFTLNVQNFTEIYQKINHSWLLALEKRSYIASCVFVRRQITNATDS